MFPDREEAERLLREGERCNPGGITEFRERNERIWIMKKEKGRPKRKDVMEAPVLRNIIPPVPSVRT